MAEQNERAAVLLIHGIYMTPRMLRYLGRQLQAAGYQVYYFGYAGTRQPVAQVLRQLDDCVAGIDAPQLHFVAHSLGGLLLLRWLHDSGDARPGRVVTLGSSHLGSGVARRLCRIGLGKLLLGEARQILCEPGAEAPAGRQVGVIAGTLPLGLGRIVGGAPSPSDGAVGVTETRLAGMQDYLLLPVSHSGMLFSPRVARAALGFLAEGHFPSLK